MLNKIMIGRQEILDHKGELIAYELLFRDGAGNFAHINDERFASSTVLSNALHGVGLDDLIGSQSAFINVDKRLLLSPAIFSVPADRFVLEILEHVDVDDEVIARITELCEQGYKIAIDDYDFSKDLEANFQRLFPFVTILKIDLMAIENIAQHKETLHALKAKGIELLAEKVETKEEYELCKELGFGLFQGYFFAKPTIIEGQKIDPAKQAIISVMRLIIANEENSVIVEELQKHPTIAISILKFLNSPTFGLRRELGSIQQAVSLLGAKPLLKYLTLLLYAAGEEEAFRDAITQKVLLRCEVMKLVAQRADKDLESVAYFVGMVSMLSLILHKDDDDIMREFGFSDEVKTAVKEGNILLGKVLCLAKRVEEFGSAEMCAMLKDELSLSYEEINTIYNEAYGNVVQLMQNF